MIDQLSKYIKMWNLDDPHPLAKTATSHVYTVNSDGRLAVLKLLSTVGMEERDGAVALRWFDGRGAVRLLRADEHAHLLEYAEGDSLVTLVKRGEDETATAIIAETLNKLHAAPRTALPRELKPLRLWFRSLFAQADQDRTFGLHSLYTKAAPVAEALLTDPRDVCVLHGDIHHENIRHNAQRGWLAFDPKGLVGERTYDAANTLCNPLNMPTLVEKEARLLKNAKILARALGIDLSRVLAFVYSYVALSASWCLEEGQDATHNLNIAAIVEPYVQL